MKSRGELSPLSEAVEAESAETLRARIAALSQQNARLSALLSLQTTSLRDVAQRSRDVRTQLESQLDELVQAAEEACDAAGAEAPSDESTENGESNGGGGDVRVRARRDSDFDGNGRLAAQEASSGRVPRGMSIKAKEFTPRESRLTQMFGTSDDIRTVYSMFASVLILFALKVFINVRRQQQGERAIQSCKQRSDQCR